MSRNNNKNNNYYGNNYNQGNYYNGNNGQYGNYNNNVRQSNRQYMRQYNNQYYNNQNGQYQNQNMQYQQYNAYNNGNQKKKKGLDNESLKKIGIIVGIIVLVLVLFFIFKGCSKNSNNEKEIEDNETQRVGNTTFGYVTIPSDWLNLQDTTSTTGLRYSDKDLIYAITLDTSDSLNAEEFVYTARNQLQSAGVEGFVVTKVKFNDYDAYKLSGYHQGNNKYVLAYFFNADDGIAHYVGVEGPDNNSEYFKILDTFNLKK